MAVATLFTEMEDRLGIVIEDEDDGDGAAIIVDSFAVESGSLSWHGAKPTDPDPLQL